MGGTGGLDRVASNERRFLKLTASASRPDVTPFVTECECANDLCTERLDLRLVEYAPLRASAALYAVFPHDAHVDPSHDCITERHSSYWVIERRPSLEALEFFDSGAPAPIVEITAARRSTPESESAT